MAMKYARNVTVESYGRISVKQEENLPDCRTSISLPD